LRWETAVGARQEPSLVNQATDENDKSSRDLKPSSLRPRQRRIYSELSKIEVFAHIHTVRLTIAEYSMTKFEGEISYVFGLHVDHVEEYKDPKGGHHIYFVDFLRRGLCHFASIPTHTQIPLKEGIVDSWTQKNVSFAIIDGTELWYGRNSLEGDITREISRRCLLTGATLTPFEPPIRRIDSMHYVTATRTLWCRHAYSRSYNYPISILSLPPSPYANSSEPLQFASISTLNYDGYMSGLINKMHYDEAHHSMWMSRYDSHSEPLIYRYDVLTSQPCSVGDIPSILKEFRAKQVGAKLRYEMFMNDGELWIIAELNTMESFVFSSDDGTYIETRSSPIKHLSAAKEFVSCPEHQFVLFVSDSFLTAILR
jgi:hypothetical protein